MQTKTELPKIPTVQELINYSKLNGVSGTIDYAESYKPEYPKSLPALRPPSISRNPTIEETAEYVEKLKEYTEKLVEHEKQQLEIKQQQQEYRKLCDTLYSNIVAFIEHAAGLHNVPVKAQGKIRSMVYEKDCYSHYNRYECYCELIDLFL